MKLRRAAVCLVVASARVRGLLLRAKQLFAGANYGTLGSYTVRKKIAARPAISASHTITAPWILKSNLDNGSTTDLHQQD